MKRFLLLCFLWKVYLSVTIKDCINKKHADSGYTLDIGLSRRADKLASRYLHESRKSTCRGKKVYYLPKIYSPWSLVIPIICRGYLDYVKAIFLKDRRDIRYGCSVGYKGEDAVAICMYKIQMLAFVSLIPKSLYDYCIFFFLSDIFLRTTNVEIIEFWKNSS